MQDYNHQINNGVHMRLDSIIHGVLETPYLDNPFQRFHENIEKYPDFHDDIDDVSFMEYDNWERLKQFDPKDGTTVGDTQVIPMEDNDQKLYFYDVQGESPYTNPPDSNSPVIDHGLDELPVWAFNATGYNQNAVKNQYIGNLWEASKNSHAPFWGSKLFTPAFYKEDKLPTFYRQWSRRLGLETIKMRHAIFNRPGDEQQRMKMKREIESYVAETLELEAAAQLQDVYVTDRVPKQKRFATTNKAEDEQFFRYKQALDQYNAEKPASFAAKKAERYERGSLLQRVFDPLAGAVRLENGALFYKVEEKEIHLGSEEKLRAEYERLKAANEGALEVSEEEVDQMRDALIAELESNSPFTADEFQDVLDREFSVFKNGEKYDFVKDLKEAFGPAQARPAADRIMDTIPDHAFWDIKTPVTADPQKFMNPYNPFRQYHVSSFHDAREYEEYMDRRNKKENLNDGVSTRRRY